MTGRARLPTARPGGMFAGMEFPPMHRPMIALFLALGLAGCGTAPPGARLPFDAFAGIGDPTRSAVFESAYAFRSAGALAGQPAEFARAVAVVEYLAAELPTSSRWIEFSPSVALDVVAGRDELRRGLGIAADAPSQVVVELLFSASRAFTLGDLEAAERALLPPIFPDAKATLARLQAPPPLPRTRLATALAHAELNRIDREGGRESSDGGKT